MCGIAGFQGEFARELLTRMGELIAHRGPDAYGEAVAVCPGLNTVGFAHRRLSIIDLSVAASQPMTIACRICAADATNDLMLAFNGEIYNFRELRHDLVSRGHSFRSASDSEVLIHLYAAHGPEMVRCLNGIFAFAIYDSRENGRPNGVERGDLFLARDQLGVKPLYHASLPEGFVFSSELKALTNIAGISREIDLIALHQYLAYLWTPAPRTMLGSVKKLEPGHALLVRDGKVARDWSYYNLPYGQSALDDAESSIAIHLREKVAAAVERQLVSDVPVGAFLSGGLDSSAVVAMMKRSQPGNSPACYSIGFGRDQELDGSPADLPYARRAAEHLGVELRTIEVQPDIIRHLDRMLYALDEPQADPAPIMALLIAERARAEGIKVLLSGAGGDDIFSGYRRHAALRSEGIWSRLPKPARTFVAATARRSAAGRGFHPGGHWGRRIVKLFEHADLDADERTIAYFWWSGEAMRRSLYSRDFAAAVAAEDTASPLLESLARIPSERDPLNRMLYLETKHFLADHNLNYTDKTGMAAGVEVRVPLLDIDLVEFAARIPSHLKQKGMVGKYIFRKAMERDLPHDIIYREKTGFGAPLRRWLRNELREQVDDTLSTASLKNRGLFSVEAVQSLVAQDRAGRVDGAYTIFALMCFEKWCRMFVDQTAT
jgi:asparagine synthase (glutamine-hydrolysing)